MADIVTTLFAMYVLGFVLDSIAIKVMPERGLVAVLYYDLRFARWPFGCFALLLMTLVFGFKNIPSYVVESVHFPKKR